MNLSDIVKVLYRRWWVVVAVLLLTGGAVVQTIVSANDEFEATATLLLASPALHGSGSQDPSSLDGLTVGPLAVVEIVEGDGTRERLSSAGDDTDYSVTVIDDNILRVEAMSETAEGVVETADAVVDEIERIVEELNTNDPESRMTLEVLARPGVARERAVGSEDGTSSEGEDESRIEYYATGSVLFSDEGVGTAAVNPYTASGGTLRVLLEVANTESVREAILSSVPDDEADFEFVFDSRDVAPITYVTAQARSSEAAMSTLDATLAFLEEDLADRQAATGAPESTYIWYQRLSYPTQADPASGNLGRPVATVLVLGIVAAVSLAVLVDSVTGFRGRRDSEAGTDRSGTDEGNVGSRTTDRSLSATKSREAS